MRWGEWQQDKRWQEFQVHHASEIWVIYVELLVVGLRSVDSSLVWYVLHANLECLFFYVLSNASKTSKTWKNFMCVGKIQWIYCNYSALWILRENLKIKTTPHMMCSLYLCLCFMWRSYFISQHLFNLDVVLINTLQGCNVFLGLTWHVDHDAFHIGSTHTSTFLGLTAVNYGRGLKWQLHVLLGNDPMVWCGVMWSNQWENVSVGLN
jgi:hypothetical protein